MIHINFMKIDVEDAELNVLRGGKETLKNTDKFIFELLKTHTDFHKINPEDILKEIKGFKFYSINEVEKEVKEVSPEQVILNMKDEDRFRMVLCKKENKNGK